MADWLLFLLILIILAVAIGMFVLLHGVAFVDGVPERHEKEKFFKAEPGTEAVPVPSPSDTPRVTLSLIVPAYKETLRLPEMMDKTLSYLEAKQKKTPTFMWEIIVVDDGSKDETSQVALQYSKKFGYGRVRVLELVKNRGKGGAVRMGVMSARGEYMLMVDADGATEINDLDALLSKMTAVEKGGAGIVVGSRAHLEDEAVATRSILRTILMHAFHFLVSFLCVRGVRDTQCGFKLFTRSSALRTFSVLHIERWAFDVEILYIAQRMGIPIAEVAVNWHEVDGSKLSPFWAALQMARDLLRIRMFYLLRLWKMNP